MRKRAGVTSNLTDRVCQTNNGCWAIWTWFVWLVFNVTSTTMGHIATDCCSVWGGKPALEVEDSE